VIVCAVECPVCSSLVVSGQVLNVSMFWLHTDDRAGEHCCIDGQGAELSNEGLLSESHGSDE